MVSFNRFFTIKVTMISAVNSILTSAKRGGAGRDLADDDGNTVTIILKVVHYRHILE